MTRYYCDHAATTPCRPEVWAQMEKYAVQEFGNASSFHSFGRCARTAIEDARRDIAVLLGASAGEIAFTSGGTESIHLALRGAALANRERGIGIVTSAIEHEACLRACVALRGEGFTVSILKPDSQGRISPEQVFDAIDDNTTILSLTHANNEIGTILPLAEIVKAARQKKPSVLVHVDAVQSVGHIPVDVDALDVDLLSFTAHKFYGPKGIGALYMRNGVAIHAQTRGGSRHCDVHEGTESVPLIVGMAEALKAAVREMDGERAYWQKFRDEVETSICDLIPASRVNGSLAERLDHFLSISFRGIEGEDLMLRLDQRGICVSTGSACNLSKGTSSHVLDAIGLSRVWNLGTLRLTFGHGCRQLNPDQLVQEIADTVRNLRSISPFRI